jgi:hypothetical protein
MDESRYRLMECGLLDGRRWGGRASGWPIRSRRLSGKADDVPGLVIVPKAIDYRLPQRAVAIPALGWRLRY